jgi:hypothetical protein
MSEGPHVCAGRDTGLNLLTFLLLYPAQLAYPAQLSPGLKDPPSPGLLHTEQSDRKAINQLPLIMCGGRHVFSLAVTAHRPTAMLVDLSRSRLAGDLGLGLVVTGWA